MFAQPMQLPSRHRAGAPVAQLSERQADRDRRDRALLEEGIEASLDALQATVGNDLDVQVMIVAAFGDPLACEPDDCRRWRGVPIHARFAGMHADRPFTDLHRRYLALEGLRAVSPPLRDGLSVAVALLDALEDLQRRADAGDDGARAKRALIMEALEPDAPPPDRS